MKEVTASTVKRNGKCNIKRDGYCGGLGEGAVTFPGWML
jgi:hypothetical protein